MKKQVSFSTQGQRADIGDLTIFRIVPNRYANAVGPFVFLDHIAPTLHAPDKPKMEKGTGAHPHRGIATLTYLLHGEGEHLPTVQAAEEQLLPVTRPEWQTSTARRNRLPISELRILLDIDLSSAGHRRVVRHPVSVGRHRREVVVEGVFAHAHYC